MTAPLHALKSLKNSLHNESAIQELLECVRRPAPSDNMDMLRHRRHRARHLSVAKWCCHAPETSKKQWIRESYQLHWCETFHISTILTASCSPMHCTRLCEWWQAPSSRQRIRCGEVQIKLNRCKSIVIVQMTAPLHALKSLKNSLHNAFAIQELLECVRRPAPSDNMDMLRHRRHRARHLSVAKWCCHAPETSKKQWIRESYQLHWCETFHISTILTASCFGIPMPMHCTILCEWWQAPSSRQRIRCGEVQIKLNRCKSIVIVQMTAPLHALKSLKNSLHNAFAMQELLECVRRPTPSDNMDMLRHRRHRARHLSVAKWCCHAPETSKKQWIRESYQLHWCETFHISTILTASCSGNPMPMHCTRLCEWWQAPSSRQRIRCGEVQIKLNRCKSKVIVQMTAPFHALKSLKNSLHNESAIQELLECVRWPAPSDNMDMLRHRRHRARPLSVLNGRCHAPETSKKQWIRESYQLHWCETFHISTILTASCSPMHCTRLCEWWQAPSSRQRIRCGEVQIKLNRCKSKVIVQMTAPLHNESAIQELLECVRRPEPSDNMCMLRHRSRHLSFSKWRFHAPGAAKNSE